LNDKIAFYLSNYVRTRRLMTLRHSYWTEWVDPQNIEDSDTGCNILTLLSVIIVSDIK